jgi:Family of unknown function (DUF6166)
MIKTYIGERDKRGTAHVWVIGKDGDAHGLEPRFDLRNHSPTGFEWGYGGSGPAQLALALLADATGSDDIAMRFHQQFKLAVVGRLAKAKWRLTEDEIMGAVVILNNKKTRLS